MLKVARGFYFRVHFDIFAGVLCGFFDLDRSHSIIGLYVLLFLQPVRGQSALGWFIKILKYHFIRRLRFELSTYGAA